MKIIPILGIVQINIFLFFGLFKLGSLRYSLNTYLFVCTRYTIYINCVYFQCIETLFILMYTVIHANMSTHLHLRAYKICLNEHESKNLITFCHTFHKLITQTKCLLIMTCFFSSCRAHVCLRLIVHGTCEINAA